MAKRQARFTPQELVHGARTDLRPAAAMAQP